MRRRLAVQAAPVGQQGPPARAAASSRGGSLRSARGSLLLTTGTASIALDVEREH
jgi:hypothetical protein